MDELDALLEKVTDRHTFLVFVKALIKDKEEEDAIEKVSPSNPYGAGARGWEHNTVAAYLDACIAWTEAWLGKEKELPETPSWKSFAEFLYSGKYYE